MKKSDWIMAAMADRGSASFSPVQMQKLMFMIDQNLPQAANNFSFVPYDYGPFDVGVYRELEALERSGDIIIVGDGRHRRYALTTSGAKKGEQALQSLDATVSQYLRDLCKWVTSLSFSQLVTAIYDQYPDMKVNSVFSN